MHIAAAHLVVGTLCISVFLCCAKWFFVIISFIISIIYFYSVLFLIGWDVGVEGILGKSECNCDRSSHILV